MASEAIRDTLSRLEKLDTPRRSLVLDATQAANRCIGPSGATLIGPITDPQARELNRIVQAFRSGPVMTMEGDGGAVRVQTGTGCGSLSGEGQIILFRAYRGLFLGDDGPRWELVFMGDWVR
ncbi:MAG: hypothetical protein IPK07_21325 [Deltaproteobacteria bacterium]|nr:hypothetical protein [Deltaproteobacteria bacterium]